MRRLAAIVAVFAAATSALGCAPPPQQPVAPAAPPTPPPPPPTPASVTAANPGGDAKDPEGAALLRLLQEPVLMRRVRGSVLLFPLADARNWQSVKIWGSPSYAAFRFGDDHFGVAAAWYKPTSQDHSPEACLARFIADAKPSVEKYGVRLVRSELVHTTQQGRVQHPMVVQVIDAQVDSILAAKAYAGALASIMSFRGTCLVAGFVVPAEKHPELARQVRDRWVTDAAPRLAWSARVTAPPPFEEE